MTVTPEDLIKLGLAILAGGLVGAEREFRDKAAGFRTIIFICVGATLFTIFSLKLGADTDPVRIAANIVSGVGFLGAGVILREKGQIVGLTTASTIWLSAALGMGIGGGQILFSGIALAAILVVLWVFPSFERWIDDLRHARTYRIVCDVGPDKRAKLDEMFKKSRLRTGTIRQAKIGDDLVVSWQATGSPKQHSQLEAMLIADEDVKQFEF